MILRRNEIKQKAWGKVARFRTDSEHAFISEAVSFKIEDAYNLVIWGEVDEDTNNLHYLVSVKENSFNDQFGKDISAYTETSSVDLSQKSLNAAIDEVLDGLANHKGTLFKYASLTEFGERVEKLFLSKCANDIDKLATVGTEALFGNIHNVYDMIGWFWLTYDSYVFAGVDEQFKGYSDDDLIFKDVLPSTNIKFGDFKKAFSECVVPVTAKVVDLKLSDQVKEYLIGNVIVNGIEIGFNYNIRSGSVDLLCNKHKDKPVYFALESYEGKLPQVIERKFITIVNDINDLCRNYAEKHCGKSTFGNVLGNAYQRSANFCINNSLKTIEQEMQI